MTQSFPTLHLDDLTAAELAGLNGKTFFVEEAGIRYPCRLKLLEGADKLFIMLNGAVDQVKTPLPVFARWNWGKILNGHVLAICDPTLYLNEKIRIGWFLGTSENHAIPGLVSLVKKAGNSLEIAASQRIFYGSSGGGFSAIVAAALCGNEGRAIAINPQTDIFAYYPKAVDAVIKALGDTAVTNSQLFPERWSALAAMAKGRDAGSQPRLVIAQNTVDHFHYRNHFLPFVQKFGVPKSGGVDAENSMMSIVYTSPEGHGAEPPELVKRITEEAIPFLCR